MPREKTKTFTERELEILQILWERGEASVKDIQEALPPGRHYNTILTIIRVLERKKHITHRQEGRGFIYRAKAAQQKSQTRVLQHVIEDVFGGSPQSIVLNLVEAGNLTLDDLDEIRRKLKRQASGKDQSK